MKLLVDIGNLRIKWVTSDQLTGRSELQAKEYHSELIMAQSIHTRMTDLGQHIGEQFAKLPDPDSVWVASVSGDAVESEIRDVCETLWNLSPHFPRSSANAVGVRNCYTDPGLLGIDRWLAIVAGRNIAGQGPLLVVDAGTAVTIDFVDDRGNFLGGVIFPGLVTMIESLNLSTGLIQEQIELADVHNLHFTNTNTRSAVANGTALSVVGGIDKAIDHYLFEAGENLNIIITGGDAELIAGLSAHQMAIEPNLVLTGLMLLSGDKAR